MVTAPLKSYLTFLLLVGASAITGQLGAEELIFTNGDRLTGEVISQSAQSIVFDAPMIGRIEVSTEDAQLASSMPATAVATAAPATPDKGSRATARPKTDSKIKPWSGNVEVGFREAKGRKDSFSIDVRATAERTTGVNSFKANTRILRGEQSNVVNKSRYDGSFRWRREIGERTFAQTLTSYYKDHLTNINSNWEQNVGAGYRLYKSDHQAVNIGGGLTAQYRDEEQVDARFYTLVEFFQDYSFEINKRFKFVQDAVVQYSPDGRSRFVTIANQPTATTENLPNYKVRFNTALLGKITDRIQLNLRYEYEFDNALSSDSSKSDQRITSSIAYGF